MEGEKIIYGINPVIELLRSRSREISKIILSYQKKGKDVEIIKTLAKERNIKLSLRNRDKIDAIAGTMRHQGVVALVSEKTFLEVEDLVELSFEDNKEPVLLILDGITDSHNLGAVIRSAEALGVAGIVIPKDRSAGITASVGKSSAGAVEHMKIAKATNIARTLEYLKKKGFWIYGADEKSKKDVYYQSFNGPVGLVMGNEKEGIRTLVQEKCDFLISIPMKGRTGSLNVSTASAIIIYEIFRQRVKNKEEKSIDKDF
jgi:23S rRNA (guanosine2251-2'-O)-methyltransferase